MKFEVSNASFSYNQKQIIIDNITLTLQSGEILSILGPNGVGKTTFLKSAIGLLKWKAGKSLIDSKDINDFSSKKLWQKIAYVPQAKQTSFAFTAFEMVLFGRNMHLGALKNPSKEDENISAKVMEEIGVYDLKDKYLSQMSGGELQMVLIARAMASMPQMLVLDEPESNLDFKNQLIVLNTIKNLSRKKGLSIILNTHYPEHALELSDYSLILRRNLKPIYGNTKDVINEENLAQTFGVDVAIKDFLIKGEKKYFIKAIGLKDKIINNKKN